MVCFNCDHQFFIITSFFGDFLLGLNLWPLLVGILRCLNELMYLLAELVETALREIEEEERYGAREEARNWDLKNREKTEEESMIKNEKEEVDPVVESMIEGKSLLHLIFIQLLPQDCAQRKTTRLQVPSNSLLFGPDIVHTAKQ